MNELFFGTGGVPHSARERSTVSGIERISELGLGSMEMEFVQGVRMSEAVADQVAEAAKKTGIKLSAHAPYYINLNAKEPAKIAASQERILQTARIAARCGAESIVFHAAFYLDNSPEATYATVKKQLAPVLDQLKSEHNRVWVRPEIMGKSSQFGTIEEVLNLSTELDGVMPAIDFAHWHARHGQANSYAEFAAVLARVKERLGDTALANMHIHLSGIAYGEKGERNHLNLKDSDLRYTELLQALKDFGVRGLLICESPNLEEDALLLQETYRQLPQSA
jgi:deoxyribonuclease-4